MNLTSNNALIVIDMQNCFINNENKQLSKKIINHLDKNKYDFIIFTKFVINDKNPNLNLKFIKWMKDLNKNEFEICKELKNHFEINYMFEKDTYSIFKSEKIIKFLKKNKILKLFLCGLDLDACVLASAFEAFDLGYEFEILYELCESSSRINLKSAARKIIQRNLMERKN